MREGNSHNPGAATKSRCAFACSIASQLVALHALCQVWLPDGVLQQHEKLVLRFFSPATIAQNAAAHVNLVPASAVHEGM